ncbi:MAG TPA: queuosine precursor transporter [Flavobacteriales bacterium]|nr:queuosine precursor transporter [Flavobacteriales bacterium]HNU55862.1 queuosine precursor transporter [Flavobacteriales bacterium]
MVHALLADKANRLFVVLAGCFIANALLAEMIGVKLFQLETAVGLGKADFTLLGQPHLSFVLSVGVLPWPLVFILTDVINDYYGVRGVRFLTLLTAVIIAFAFLVLYLAIAMPPDMGWWIGSGAAHGVPDMQAAFANIFGQSMNIIIGSIAAFIIGQLADAFIFRRIKRLTGDKRIWLRATGSTLISQLIDSVVVTYLAFWALRDMPFPLATALVLTAYTYKLVVAILATPLIYLAHALIERYLGKEKAHSMRENALRSAAEQ